MLYIILVLIGILFSIVLQIWIISEGVQKGLISYEKWKKDNKEK